MPEQPDRHRASEPRRSRNGSRPRRWGSLRGGAGVSIVAASAALGAIITIAYRAQPGRVLGVCIVVGTVVAALAVRPRAGRLIFPVPVLAYLIAALTAGIAYNRSTSKSELVIGAAQWIANGFLLMALATGLAIVLVTVRWILRRRDRRAHAVRDPGDRRDPRGPGPQPGQRPPASDGPGQRNGPYPGQQDGQFPGQGYGQHPGLRPAPGYGPYSGQRPGQGNGQYPGPDTEQPRGQGNPPRPGPDYGQYPEQRPGQGYGQYPGPDTEQPRGQGNPPRPGPGYGQYPEQRPGQGYGQYSGRAGGQSPHQRKGPDPDWRYDTYPDQHNAP